ncbi:MAG: flagellar export chaperone FlgN [Lachnospiraceae bacterium]|nr:flagellar export chaperone FlgN [Lachnospiraceae bacterium]
MSEQYLTILAESLKKKLSVMDEIIRLSKMQKDILTAESIDFEEFDRCVDDKDICIEQLRKLDDGFEIVYDRVEQELKDNKQKYAAWIKESQALISMVIEKSVEIQALEARNKQMIEESVKRERRNLGQGKRSVEVARNYYRNMSYTNVMPPQFLDQKK